MASYKTAFGSYIKAEDLQGRAVMVTIESVVLEDLGKDGKSEKKLVARFHGKDKSLILNRTNADALAYAFNTENYDHWRGPVILYPDTTMYGGKRVACVRVKPADKGAPQTEPAPAPAEPVTSDDIPF